jgi:hypothetical protein
MQNNNGSNLLSTKSLGFTLLRRYFQDKTFVVKKQPTEDNLEE